MRRFLVLKRFNLFALIILIIGQTNIDPIESVGAIGDEKGQIKSKKLTNTIMKTLNNMKKQFIHQTHSKPW